MEFTSLVTTRSQPKITVIRVALRSQTAFIRLQELLSYILTPVKQLCCSSIIILLSKMMHPRARIEKMANRLSTAYHTAKRAMRTKFSCCFCGNSDDPQQLEPAPLPTKPPKDAVEGLGLADEPSSAQPDTIVAVPATPLPLVTYSDTEADTPAAFVGRVSCTHTGHHRCETQHNGDHAMPVGF